MYKKRNPLIFILSGKAKSGKDVVANIIKEYYGKDKCISVAYAYYLKDYLKRMNKYNENEKAKYRSLLQEFGIDFLGKYIDSKFLINRLLEDVEVFSYFYDVIIITDARLVDEIEIVKNKYQNVITIKITTKNNNNLTPEQNNHITETALDNYTEYDYEIENNDDLESLSKKIKSIVSEVSINE